MREQVHRVLFASSLYESFILAEDGNVHERVPGGFMPASAHRPADLVRVSSGGEALAALRGAPGAAWIAGLVPWQGDARIMMAVVKAVEDRLDVDAPTARGVPVVLGVEDSVRCYSSLLPVICEELLDLSASGVAETGSRLRQLLRLRARPKLLLSTRWEGAWSDFQAHRDPVIGVISDAEFPRDGIPTPRAGRERVDAVRRVTPEGRIPLQASNPEDGPGGSSLWRSGAGPGGTTTVARGTGPW
jgi:hypothetical protein